MGIIVGAVTLTGVGFKISFAVTAAAGTASDAVLATLPFLPLTPNDVLLFFTLALTAIVCILLGYGVPTTATYIIMVTVAAPALTLLGVAPLVAHFFVFYYGVLADITPPVAIAAYAGASMAGADPVRSGNTAFRLGIGKALVPFAFVYSPSMLLVTADFTWSAFALSVASCVVGILFLSAAFSGWMKSRLSGWERWSIGLAALPTLAAHETTLLIGFALAAPTLIRQYGLQRVKGV